MAVLNSNDARYNKLMIRGPFGVGKSVLLRDKAIQLNEQPEYKGKVIYVLGYKPFDITHSMLYFRMTVELKEKHGIKVEDIKSSGVSSFSLRITFFLLYTSK